MSRGLGKVQHCIIERLKMYDGAAGLKWLVIAVFHPERFLWKGEYYWHDDLSDWTYSRAEYVSVHRAVKSLESRGIVETKASTCYDPRYNKGGALRYTRVQLSVDYKDN